MNEYNAVLDVDQWIFDSLEHLDYTRRSNFVYMLDKSISRYI